MFKCSECDKEYEIKPDYCDDCGNDEFIEIKENISVEENIINPQEIKQETKEQFENKSEKISKSEIKKEIKPEEIISYAIFLSCIILSFIIVFLINPPAKEETETIKEEPKAVVEIPAIDTFWNSEPPKNVQISKKVEQVPQIKKSEGTEVEIKEPQTKIAKIEQKIIPNEKPKNTIQSNNVNKTQPQTQKKQSTIQNPIQNIPKNTAKAQTQTQQKSVQQPVLKPKQQVSQSINTTTKTTSSQPVWNYNQAQNNTKTQTQQAQTIQTPDKILASKKELTNYKANLRNTIGRKIDFADVIGDGACTISFKIDSSGKLVNRAFAKQSTNTTLNDVVYKAVMATPSYNPPPSAYNGETLSLKISFYNGNFEISLN